MQLYLPIFQSVGLIVCSSNHPIEVNYKFGDKYRGYINSFYNCGSCKRYMICQPSFKCCECKEYFCFECKEEKSIGESGNNDTPSPMTSYQNILAIIGGQRF